MEATPKVKDVRLERRLSFDFQEYRRTYAALLNLDPANRGRLARIIARLRGGDDFDGLAIQPPSFRYTRLSQAGPGEFIALVDDLRLRLKSLGPADAPWEVLEIVSAIDPRFEEVDEDPPGYSDGLPDEEEVGAPEAGQAPESFIGRIRRKFLGGYMAVSAVYKFAAIGVLVGGALNVFALFVGEVNKERISVRGAEEVNILARTEMEKFKHKCLQQSLGSYDGSRIARVGIKNVELWKYTCKSTSSGGSSANLSVEVVLPIALGVNTAHIFGENDEGGISVK